MGALFSILYGLSAYGACLATLGYLVGFLANLVVPKSIDLGGGTPADWPAAVATDLALVALFGLQHSVMARRSFKRWWTTIVPPAVERSTFVVATCLVLGLLFVGWVPLAAPLVWRIQSPAGVALAWALFALGWVLLLVSSFLINHFELFGLQQVFARLGGRPLPEVAFKTPWLYGVVRHPIYVGLLLGFWATPVMTAGHLLFAVAATAYIFIGIAFEERDLIAQFGDRYRRYRAEVGMLLPWRSRA